MQIDFLGGQIADFGRFEVLRTTRTLIKLESNRMIKLLSLFGISPTFFLVGFLESVTLGKKLVVSKEKAPPRKDKISVVMRAFPIVRPVEESILRNTKRDLRRLLIM